MPIVQRSLVLFPSCFLELVSHKYFKKTWLILVNMLSFVDAMASVTDSQLCLCSTKAAMDNRAMQEAWLCSNEPHSPNPAM